MAAVPFGWCLDELHDRCIGKFPDHQCICTCHQAAE